MTNTIQTVLVWALPVLLAITLHEAAHAYAARFFGDPTAYREGRMTLNPLRHIDPVGTLFIPAVMLIMGSPVVFGYAKPVPVNFGWLSHPRRDTALVALAGPVSNLLMGFLWAVLKLVLLYGHMNQGLPVQMAEAGISINLVLFAFNLFPLPPLDGGRIMMSLLPAHLSNRLAGIERYGFFIVLGLAYLGLTAYWVRPLMYVGRWIIGLFLYPLLYFFSL